MTPNKNDKPKTQDDRDKPPYGLPDDQGLPSQNEFNKSEWEWVQLSNKVNPPKR